MSQDQKNSITISVIGVLLSASIAFGGVAFASGGIVERVEQTEEKMLELKEDINNIRLGVNRVDERTRDQDKALARIEGQLSRK